MHWLLKTNWQQEQEYEHLSYILRSDALWGTHPYYCEWTEIKQMNKTDNVNDGIRDIKAISSRDHIKANNGTNIN